MQNYLVFLSKKYAVKNVKGSFHSQQSTVCHRFYAKKNQNALGQNSLIKTLLVQKISV